LQSLARFAADSGSKIYRPFCIKYGGPITDGTAILVYLTLVFSILDQRVTLLDSSLFSASAPRNKELLERFGLIGAALVDLAVTHEMGHGICQDTHSPCS
jgi:hypothetical protein